MARGRLRLNYPDGDFEVLVHTSVDPCKYPANLFITHSSEATIILRSDDIDDSISAAMNDLLEGLSIYTTENEVMCSRVSTVVKSS